MKVIGEFLIDKSLLIFCDENIQIERIKERDKVDTQNAINIIKNQLSLLEKKQRADYIIENNGTKEEFYKKLNSFLDKINDLNNSHFNINYLFSKYWFGSRGTVPSSVLFLNSNPKLFVALATISLVLLI